MKRGISIKAELINWLKKNLGKQFQSPRVTVFNRKADDFKILSIDEWLKRVKITFIDNLQREKIALPLFFWMFERTINYLQQNRRNYIILGAKPQPPYILNSLEGEIWKTPYPYSSTYKVSPHICDILVLAGIARYGYTINPQTGRRVQGISLFKTPKMSTLSQTVTVTQKDISTPIPPKTNFLFKHKPTILKWVKAKENIIKDSRINYSWKNKTTKDCVESRNKISKKIILSRIRNSGGIDLKTLDEVTKWGFGRKFPLRNPDKVREITRKAFNYLDNGNIREATKTLLKIKNVGISRASKILGLFDQENLCIYDSRVGNALKDLMIDNEKIILSPPGYNREYDVVPKPEIWAEYYEKLIWTLEVMKNYLNAKGCTFRLADVEMALFMMGK